MKNKAKVMRLTERALKRTKSYLENRAANVDPKDNYQLDYVLIKKDRQPPDDVIGYAHFEDSIISFHPLERNVEESFRSEWAFSSDGDLFFYLERGYELAGMSLIAHEAAWREITENHGDDYLQYLVGMQKYLRYCKENGITVERLQKECRYDGLDVMKLYDKSTFKVKSTGAKI